ncbi:type II secretion system protein M [Vibrio sp. LaRot3]|uniref:type II secretion system protein M n=1 Tax=Vibrio sp. LaRot3 TaxID=2998829 RepID=UPI0022CDD96A|nr:type II secretion system protein M [Vibrio sp. LaRot3]MDA0149343.1 type II secretion system protein M [Vibrio sp. LaRot3]
MNKLLASFNQWWSSITQREQRLVSIGGAALLFGVIYWGIYQPIADSAAQAQQRIQNEKQLLSWVQKQADTISSLKAAGGQSISPLPFNQAISSSARRFKIELVRVQPRGEEMQVWVQPVAFNQLVNWLDYLNTNHAIDVIFLDIDKTARSGEVEIKRLQLSKG